MKEVSSYNAMFIKMDKYYFINTNFNFMYSIFNFIYFLYNFIE